MITFEKSAGARLRPYAAENGPKCGSQPHRNGPKRALRPGLLVRCWVSQSEGRSLGYTSRSRKTGGRHSGRRLAILRSDIRCPLSCKGDEWERERRSRAPEKPPSPSSQPSRVPEVKLFCASRAENGPKYAVRLAASAHPDVEMACECPLWIYRHGDTDLASAGGPCAALGISDYHLPLSVQGVLSFRTA
jgi:hypothetical protein